MSSAPVPNIPRRRHRSFAGPIILILLGVIFLLGNLHMLAWHGIGLWFAHYWPVLLILWGVIKLIEFYQARSAGYAPSGIGFGGGILIVFLVLLGLGASTASRVNWSALHDEVNWDNGPWDFFGNKYEYSHQVNQDLPANSPVHLSIERGSITVLPSTDGKVHMSVHKTIVANSKDEADKIDQATDLRLMTEPMVPAIPPIPPVPSPAPSASLPKNLPGLSEADQARIQSDIAKAQADARRAGAEAARSAGETARRAGAMARAQAEEARADAERAREEVLHIDAPRRREGYAVMDIQLQVPLKSSLELSTAHGKIEVRGRQGNLTLTNTNGDISLNDITGNVNANLRHGDFTAGNITGNVSLNGSLGDATISNVTGLVNLGGDYFGDLSLTNISNAVNFNSSRTDMQLGKLAGEIKWGSGDMRISGASGGFRLHTRSTDVHLENIGGDVDVDNSNADVELHAGKLSLGNVGINNRSGSIQVFLPATGAFQLEAQTHGGDIESDFSGIKVQTEGDNATASGAIGQNGKRIQLSTQHADIEIRKSGAMAVSHDNSANQSSSDSKDDSDVE